MGSRAKKTLIASEREREDSVEARAEWHEMMKTLDPAKLIFIDESGFAACAHSTKMPRLRGRAAKGASCIGAVPYGHWGNNSFIAELRHDPVDAPMLIEGAVNGAIFAAWVGQPLAPTLKPRDIVICDTLNVHKNAEARKAIETKGEELRFLPAYSPDLNPIERLLAKIKGIVRSAAARCFDTLCDALKTALEAVRPDECSNYIRHAGYDTT